MIEIRFHGRGGQGAVTSAELVAQAAIGAGKFATAFPSFGPERRGAPVVAFARVDDRPVRLRSKIYCPDVVVVLDPSLLEIANPAEGIRDGGVLVINFGSSRKCVPYLKSEKDMLSAFLAIETNLRRRGSHVHQPTEALAKLLGNGGRLGPVNLCGVILSTESIVSSIFVSFAQTRPCFGHTSRVETLS